MRTLVFVGNFEVPYSTESHHLWTWCQRLNWNVIPLQEDKTPIDQIVFHIKNADLFSWTHTHDYNTRYDGYRIINELRGARVPSFSYHLDRYWGIKNRQTDYLKHASFHLDYFFSTDGGNNALWENNYINHRWLLPGVVENACYIMHELPSNFIPVLFCGSTGYHSEYPFRPKMIQELQKNYQNKFQVRDGIREAPLNDLYASTKVIVGDHIFAGCPRYCSDRLFETIGRGGFIIYPETEGITEWIPGLVTYKPQDISDLISKIDYFLDTKHEAERIERRNASFEWVKKNGTYTVRLRQILETMNLA